ncbi:hypothetical protein EVAR_69206_1 [Eumeta japonica]|uniref:Threonylcarbamoyl-AMP synthase n=1 Tax=Eumeta variegata TaxID=151549 RepID=A0A4C1T8A0_EUMVA|nr:hypothetical protein EVAR_69206_1 [Eumeta japonica]
MHALPENQVKAHVYNVDDSKCITIARNNLRSGNVIALPTDTVYGLACDANNEKAIQKLYSIKGEIFPLALTSANRSAERSSLDIKEFQVLWPMLGAIFDAGQVGITEERRSASTVVDLALPGNSVGKARHLSGGQTIKAALAVISPNATGPNVLESKECPV